MQLIKNIWMELLESDREHLDWWVRQKELYDKREAKVVNIKGKGHVYHRLQYDNEAMIYYHLHLAILLKQDSHFIREERVIPNVLRLKSGEIVEHRQVEIGIPEEQKSKLNLFNEEYGNDERFTYDRRAAVQYAERWWNSYNPAYRKFDVDCTNYISQCLRAGGAPMRGAPNRSQGWWYQGNNWSYSWSVAHAFRWFLGGSKQGLKGTEVESPMELQPGDVICYDFEGDGKWNHTTIVVAKDANGEPLVNAHTYNSRHRYWAYEDSTAYTPNIKYKFFRIGD